MQNGSKEKTIGVIGLLIGYKDDGVIMKTHDVFFYFLDKSGTSIPNPEYSMQGRVHIHKIFLPKEDFSQYASMVLNKRNIDLSS